MKNERDRVLALAAVFQAAALVSGIARSGRWEPKALEASIYSLFQIDAESVEAVFGGMEGLELGLRTLHGQIGDGKKADVDLARYVIQLLHHERRLAKSPAMLRQIGQGIERAQGRLSHFPMVHDNILGQFGDLYSETISTLQPRIMVNGDQLHLQDSANVHRIRALLLAGIRAARLWQQCGGARWQIILQRGKIRLRCGELLEEMGGVAAADGPTDGKKP